MNIERRRAMKVAASSVSGMLFRIPKWRSQDEEDQSPVADNTVEIWGIFELQLSGPSDGNPFIDVEFTVTFCCRDVVKVIDGFYDGGGIYRVRFMPDIQGAWRFTTASNRPPLDGYSGSFSCREVSRASNHGPVRVRKQFHFCYADETPFFPFGTTCYSFGFVDDIYKEEVLAGLGHASFNKVRMSVLTKPSSTQHVSIHPFAIQSGENAHGKIILDVTRFNPLYFRSLEFRIKALLTRGIEAELILFYSHDCLSNGSLDVDADERYIRYVIARLAAFRNVWWSLANEYDLIKLRNMGHWDRYFQLIQDKDVYGHPRSIHHSKVVYDHSKPWVTHASLQSYAFDKASEYRSLWRKPVIWDEMQYEGNISARWGNISAREMTRRFWMAVVWGTYGTHGETYIVPERSNAWTISGRLKGESPVRIAFLRRVLQEYVPVGLEPLAEAYYPGCSEGDRVFLFYLDNHQPKQMHLSLPNAGQYECFIIDSWEMTKRRVRGLISNGSVLELPGKPHIAVLLKATQ